MWHANSRNIIRHRNGLRIWGTSLTLLAAISLSACSTGQSTSPQTTQSAATPSASAPAESTPQETKTTQTPTPTETKDAPSDNSDKTKFCKTTALKFSIGRVLGAAGSQYYPLVAKNTSSTPCVIAGYPGVSATDQDGKQIGAAAVRESRQNYETITLKPGETATATLRVTNTGALDNCSPVQSKHLKIYPPEQKEATQLPVPLTTCSTQRESLTIAPFSTKQP